VGCSARGAAIGAYSQVDRKARAFLVDRDNLPALAELNLTGLPLAPTAASTAQVSCSGGDVLIDHSHLFV
jgi:hypothetical protein